MDKPGPSTPNLVYCKWDHCTYVFADYQEWDNHFVVDHMPYERPVDLTGRWLRRRRDGVKELLPEDFQVQDALPLPQQASQPSQTDPDTTTTTTTTNPLPPSFQSLPDPPASLPTSLILPSHTQEGEEVDMDVDDPPFSAGYNQVYTSYIRSRTPSPSPHLRMGSRGPSSIPISRALGSDMHHSEAYRAVQDRLSLDSARRTQAARTEAHHSRDNAQQPQAQQSYTASTPQSNRTPAGPSGSGGVGHTSFFSPLESDFSGPQAFTQSQPFSTPSSYINSSQSDVNNNSMDRHPPPGEDCGIDQPQQSSQAVSPPNQPHKSGMMSLQFGAALADGELINGASPLASRTAVAGGRRTSGVSVGFGWAGAGQ